MTVSSALGTQKSTSSGRQAPVSGPQQASCPSSSATSTSTTTTTTAATSTTTQTTPSGGFNQSLAFQQVKQTQASLARLARVHQQLQCQNSSSNTGTQSSQHAAKSDHQSSGGQQQQVVARSTTFVDCLIRRFKDCFSEECCTVPMFVVGNLSPGSDGTHLILPPCVSLACQSMSRFASPKNLRHMNSIRDSCKSIEELDLGGNKLNDLIEVYKILQCMPNLKFLNLSENDLSRTSPVAMAASPSSSSSATTPITTTATGYSPVTSSSSSSTATNSSHNHPTIAFGSSVSQWNQHNQSNQPITRSFLAPLNTNQLGGRRHSTLGQTSSGAPTVGGHAAQVASNRATRLAATSRMAEARRLAATNALAQSKKTSSMVANKLTSSVAAAATSNRSQGPTTRTNGIPTSSSASALASVAGSRQPQSESPRKMSSPGGGKSPRASTMHLARSLSSLSAKDVRASLGNSAAAAAARRQLVASTRSKLATTSRSAISATVSQPQAIPTATLTGPTATTSRLRQPTASRLSPTTSGIRSAKSQAKPEPIVEAEGDLDVDMTTTATVAVAPTSLPVNVTHRLQVGGTSGNSQTLGNNNHQQQTSQFRRTFESIKALALNNTGCPWRVVCSILSRMPNLEELHLSLNNYERIDLEPQEFKHFALKRLYLCNNPKLTNFEELNKLLLAFPSLEALSIADCNISQIPDNLNLAQEWKRICGLNINGWPIKEWPIIERLNQLPSLIDLKCRNLEILSTIDEPRHHLIARLPKLQRLNGSEIEEREHAEKEFLKFFMTNSHLERPSRFHELIQIHGEIKPSVDVDLDLSPPSQAQVKVIYLNRNYFKKENEDDILMSEDFLLRLMDNIDSSAAALANETNESNHENNSMEVVEFEPSQAKQQPVRLLKDDGQEVLAIEVDLRQSVRKFKSTLANLFGLESQNLILYYIDHEMVGLMGPELIKHNQKKLWNYNVQDGDQFIVEER